MNKNVTPDTFIRLRDTPHAYGTPGQNVVVNAQGNGVGFLMPSTVASLPPSGVAALGSILVVTDAGTPLSWGATVVGGGTSKAMVWFDGSNWTVIGK